MIVEGKKIGLAIAKGFEVPNPIKLAVKDLQE